MPSASLLVGIGIVLLIIGIIAYNFYQSKSPTPTPGDRCVATTTCQDKWYDYDSGQEIAGVKSVCVGGQIQKPYFGPGKCANPCGPDRTPCWDDVKKIGVCYPGANAICPCNDDNDCGGASQGSCNESTRKCECKTGWSGAACETKSSICDAKDPMACGHGTCVNGACVCDDGWADYVVGGVRKPCSICKDGRGPPGNCKLVKYPGVAVPVPIGSIDPKTGQLVKCFSPDQNPNDICHYFYPGTTVVQISPPVGNSTAMCANGSGFSCPAHPQADTQAMACAGPNGIWASPSFDAANYQWWKPTNCKLTLPDGFVGDFY